MRSSTISLCIITRDEEQLIKQCILSVQGLVNEVIVVDTGSTDNTVEIAKKNGACVLDYVWDDDFSKARNFSIQNARSEWILILDADECISKEDHKKILGLTAGAECDAFAFPIRSYTDSMTEGWCPNISNYEEGKFYSGYIETQSIRLFRKQTNLHFSGIIHESLVCADGSIPPFKFCDIPIHHNSGLRGPDAMASRLKRFLKTHQKKILNEPENPAAHFELGRRYLDNRMYKEAVRPFEKCLRLDPASTNAILSLAIAFWKLGELVKSERILNKYIRENASPNAYVVLGSIYMESGETEKALEAFETAIEYDPNHLAAHNNIGIIYERRRQHRKSIPFFEAALKINPNYVQAKENLAVAYEDIADWVSAFNTYRDLLIAPVESASVVKSRLKAVEQCL